nr:MAG TPA: hypothetical protein [Caudoviricetes sp.]
MMYLVIVQLFPYHTVLNVVVYQIPADIRTLLQRSTIPKLCV